MHHLTGLSSTQLYALIPHLTYEEEETQVNEQGNRWARALGPLILISLISQYPMVNSYVRGLPV